ncbi:MAG: MFS transporter, partial [Chloroflexota bacterium]|nr:MFS transporter [Chloroflexota bacterium]
MHDGSSGRLGSVVPWLAAFGVFGLLYGFWPVLLADLSAALGLSPGPLGLALSVGFVGSLPAMVAAGRAVDRWGRRAVTVGAGAAMAMAWVGFALVPGFAALVGVLVFFYAASGVYDVGINAAAIAAEQRTGRRLLPLCHGTFSG